MLLKINYIKRLKYILFFTASFIILIVVINNSARALFPLKYSDYVFRYSVENNIDPYLVFAIIKAESSFNPKATSQRNARGLMQISDTTGNWGAESLKLLRYSANELYEPETNIQIGCWYLGRLMKEFDDNIDLVITAYNGGSGNVSEWLKNRDYSDSGDSLEKIPFGETERFLKKVKNYHLMYKRLYGMTV